MRAFGFSGGGGVSEAEVQTIIDGQAGEANGLATLDGSGKIPVSQLPTSVMEYQGTYNASTNTPSLVDGVGDTGDFYRVSVAGTRDFGSGDIILNVGDDVIYSGTVWQRVGDASPENWPLLT